MTPTIRSEDCPHDRNLLSKVSLKLKRLDNGGINLNLFSQNVTFLVYEAARTILFLNAKKATFKSNDIDEVLNLRSSRQAYHLISVTQECGNTLYVTNHSN